jgi:quinol monooxygenase YgiN
MIFMTVKFETSLSEAEVIAVARERADQFRALPGLIQKYYVKLNEPGHFGGYYVWDSMESLRAYRESELASTIASAYKVVGTPEIEVLETLFPLRD